MSNGITRRQLLKTSAAASAGVGLTAMSGCQLVAPQRAEATVAPNPREVKFYDRLSGNKVQCHTCPRECVVLPGERGECGVRENRGGHYYLLVWGQAAALNVDPIEKKPLFHFLPGSYALSIGTVGCNFNCRDCQNWEISQALPEDSRSHSLPPEKAVELAPQQNCRTIAYTYNEPIAFYGYMYDTAKMAADAGLRSVMISNGYINSKPLREVAQYLDAIKVDWKGTTEKFYRDYCDGTLQPVLDTMYNVKEMGKWLEIVYLVVPTVNDSAAEIKKLAQWIKKYLGADTPLHFSRFHPAYKLKNLPPTPYSTLERCHDVARENGLEFVYLGNVPGHEYESTFCPNCDARIIDRRGFRVRSVALDDGKCPECGTEIPGVWS